MSEATLRSLDDAGVEAGIDDELSDEALDRPVYGSALICVGICGQE